MLSLFQHFTRFVRSASLQTKKGRLKPFRGAPIRATLFALLLNALESASFQAAKYCNSHLRNTLR